MTAMASPGGMLPEQVWEADPIPSRRLAPGRPTGSAMPLVWAHAEFIKLMVSRHLGRPVDRPRAVWRRYQGRRPAVRHAFWWQHAPIKGFDAGARLAVALPRAALVHWMAGTMPWTRQTVTAVSVSTSLHWMSATCRRASASFSPGN